MSDIAITITICPHGQDLRFQVCLLCDDPKGRRINVLLSERDAKDNRIAELEKRLEEALTHDESVCKSVESWTQRAEAAEKRAGEIEARYESVKEELIRQLEAGAKAIRLHQELKAKLAAAEARATELEVAAKMIVETNKTVMDRCERYRKALDDISRCRSKNAASEMGHMIGVAMEAMREENTHGCP